MISKIHGNKISPRRQRVLSSIIGGMLPSCGNVLDVGSGDGSVALMVQNQHAGVKVVGIDSLVRPNTAIPVNEFDGERIPYGDGSFDVVMCVDVLHHTNDPQILLNEAARVTRRHVLIKDHHRNGFMAYSTLRFMDWTGNARFGVALPYNYWSEEEWDRGYSRAGLRIVRKTKKLGLYPFWADWVFGRNLHSIVLLEKSNAEREDRDDAFGMIYRER
jgi:SAM-dependent methyltransferase